MVQLIVTIAVLLAVCEIYSHRPIAVKCVYVCVRAMLHGDMESWQWFNGQHVQRRDDGLC